MSAQLQVVLTLETNPNAGEPGQPHVLMAMTTGWMIAGLPQPTRAQDEGLIMALLTKALEHRVNGAAFVPPTLVAASRLPPLPPDLKVQ